MNTIFLVKVKTLDLNCRQQFLVYLQLPAICIVVLGKYNFPLCRPPLFTEKHTIWPYTQLLNSYNFFIAFFRPIPFIFFLSDINFLITSPIKFVNPGAYLQIKHVFRHPTLTNRTLLEKMFNSLFLPFIYTYLANRN